MRWYSLISGKPIKVSEFKITWNLENRFRENLLVVDVAYSFLLYALKRRLLCPKPNLGVLLIVCYAGYRLLPIVYASSFALLNVGKEDFSIFSSCPDCRRVINVGQNRPDRLFMEIILRMVLFFRAVYFYDCSFSHIPQTKGWIHTASKNNWLVISNENWLNKTTMPAGTELMLRARGSNIEHMQRVVRVSHEDHVSLLATGHRWWAAASL